MKASPKPGKISVRSVPMTGGELGRRLAFTRILLLLTAIGCLIAMAQSASAVDLQNGGSTSQAIHTAPSSIVHSTLSAAMEGHIQTPSGTFSTSSDSRFYLRNSGALKRIYSLTGHVGLPVQLMVRDERVIWLAVETQEAIR